MQDVQRFERFHDRFPTPLFGGLPPAYQVLLSSSELCSPTAGRRRHRNLPTGRKSIYHTSSAHQEAIKGARRNPPFLTRRIASMAHPHIPPPILLLPLHTPQHGWHIAPAARRIPRMQTLLVVPVGDVDPLVPRDRVRVDGRGGRDAVLPLLLHRGVHDQQRVVRQVDGELALGVGASLVVVVVAALVVMVAGDDLADAELAGYA